MSTSNSVDASICPLCQGDNLCAEVNKQINEQSKSKPCWCLSVQFPPNIINEIPAKAKGKACICQQCTSRLSLAKAI